MDKWANFLSWEKLTPVRVDDKIMVLVGLCEELAKIRPPNISSHTNKLASRRLVCETAITMGIDLAGWKIRGKLAMGRGLLDIWNTVYIERFGSNYGTVGWKESVRRNCKTRIVREQ